MNKAELVKKMVENSEVELTGKQAEAALNSFLTSVEDALVEGDKVQLVGFGTFETRERDARQGRNPQTGEPMQIAASRSAALKIGKALKEKLNA